jgi:hypothetical protein
MRVRSIVLTVSVMLALAIEISPANAEFTWDAAADFHATGNTTAATWQYGYTTNAGGSMSGYDLFTAYAGVGPGYSAWMTDAWNFVGKDPAVTTELRCSPWNNEALTEFRTADVAWKSPITGKVDASFSVTDRNTAYHPVFDGVTYWLFKGGNSTALSQGVMADAGTTGTITVPNITVASGDMLYLQIGPGANCSADLTGINFTVSEVPEPAEMALVISALFSLMAYAWRKRK